MKIAICDDEPAQTKYISRLVDKWAENRKKPVEADAFDSAEAFEFAWSEDKSYDVLFLDIQMPGQNGMELAKTIRQSDDRLAIIFVTGFSDYMDEGYEVSALHYLIKPVDENKLFSCLDKACRNIKTEVPMLIAECGGGNIRIRQDEILYVEAFAHSVEITASGGVCKVGESIGEIEKRLDKTLFYRPHRSYIVGLKYVAKIGKTGITLDNGTLLPVSRRLYSDANRAFIDFYKR